MWELFQYLVGVFCILVGLGGACGAAVFSQDSARTSGFATTFMLMGGAWAAAMAYIAYRLFGFA